MGRGPYCSKDGLNKGAWTSQEDKILTDYVKIHGEGKWSNVAKKTGLKRCGKSCRLRWMNYQRPDIKRGNISLDEEELIVRLHKLLGNRWSLIAGRLPGRTDNEIKNYWNTNLAKKAQHHFRLTLPKLQTKPKPFHNEVPAPVPPPNGTTKPDATIITVQHQSENDETHQHDRMKNVGPYELNNSIVQSDRIYGETITIDQSCDNVDASPSLISGDESLYPSDQLMHMDFNMDDFCKILDSDFVANSVPASEEEGHEVGVAEVAPAEESDECAQAENSDYMSLISFLDPVPPEWQEII